MKFTNTNRPNGFVAKKMFKPPREKRKVWNQCGHIFFRKLLDMGQTSCSILEIHIPHFYIHVCFLWELYWPSEISYSRTYRNLVTQKYLAARTLWLWHLSSCDGSKSTSYIHLSCKMCHKEGQTNMVIPGVRSVKSISWFHGISP